jgi:RHS repeat-associated protein
MATQSGASAEALPLPKGGGSTRGLGDAFTPDLNRGTGSYAIMIEVPKGYRTLTPQLSLTYNSGGGDGPFGYGWSLPLPRIQIDTDSGVADYLNPAYIFEGETLVAMGDGLFRPRIENAFHRIRQVGDGWEVTDKSGTVTRLGSTPASRITGQAFGLERTFAWFADTVRDTNGNELRYRYRRDGGNLYLERVEYVAFEVHFEYTPRHDVTINRRAGFAVVQGLRCQTIEVRRPADAQPVIRRYTLHYLDDPTAPSLLSRVAMEGFKRQPDGTVTRTEAPPVDLGYTAFAPATRRFQVIADDLPEPPGPLGRNGLELVDLDGDGLPDVVQLGAGRPRIWRNLGQGDFAVPQLLPDFPHPLTLNAATRLFDADGRGTSDLVMLGTDAPRYYPNTGAGRFERPHFWGGRQPLAFNPADLDSALADLNGDGRVDLVRTSERGLVVWHNRGGEDGFEPPRVTPRSGDRDALPDVRLSEPGVFVADMTGDGLPDIVHIVSGLVEYWPALGSARYDRRLTMGNPPQLPRGYDPRRVFLADIDGAGASDVIYVGHDRVLIWRNLGGVRFAAPVEINGTPHTAVESIRLVDLLGSGMVGVLWSGVRASGRSGYRYLALATHKPYLLTTIREGVGLETQIEYDTSSQQAARDAAAGRPWSTHLPLPVHVVRRVTRHDMVTGFEDANELFYHEGQWEPATRRFRGFGRVTVRRSGGPDAPEAYEEHRYLVGAPGEPDIDAGDGLEAGNLARARRGQGYSTTFFSAGLESPPLRSEETHWRVTAVAQGGEGVPILFPQVVSTEVRIWEGNDRPRVVTTEYSYDQFGNVTRERRRGHAPNGDEHGNPVVPLTVITEMAYAVNTERHVVDRLASTVRRDDAGNVLAEMRHYYDGPELQGLPLGQVNEGLLVRQEEIVMTRSDAAALYGVHEPDWATLGYHTTARADNTPALAVNQTRYVHSARGMITRRVDPLGAETTFDYDADGLLVTRLANAVGHVRTATYDHAWQLMEEHVMPNGERTRYTYDGLGRLQTVVRPGDTQGFATLRYTHDHTQLPNSVRVERRKAPGMADAYVKVIYHDGLGRQIQEQTGIDANQVRASGAMRLNRRGDPIFRGQPLFRPDFAYEPPETLPPTPGFQYRYDSLGRLVAATNPDNRELRVAYTPWSAELSDVIDTDPLHPHANTPRIQHFDAFGRIAGVTLIGDAGTTHRANYTYDLLGRLVTSTDLEGRPALRAITYDGRGARLRIDHAVAGVRMAIYSARGQLVRYWDARNLMVERTFDPIGRLLTEAVDGVVQERYHYDLQADQAGRLGRVDDNAGSATFAYDARGQVTGKTRTINGVAYELGYEYDSSGLQRRLVYPNGEAVTFGRWGDGRIRSVAGLVDEMVYADTGRLVRVRHANGVEEVLDYDAAGYMATMGFRHGNQTLYDAHLRHNAAGHLVHWEERSGPQLQVENYRHDALGRLVEFERANGGAPTVWQYAYDADGNLLRADEMEAMHYDYDFNTPGALTGRTRSDGSVESIDFDAAGHLTAMEGLELVYDARGRLTHTTNDDGTVVTMTYDYRGARVAKRVTGPGGNFETRYIDELYEERAGVATAYVFAGGRLIGHLRGGGRRHLHADHRGSVVMVTRPNGVVDGRGWFGPYGNAAQFAEAEGSRQYIGAIFDGETGLYYLNLRYYSPRLGRFLSPDPRFLAQPEREPDIPEAHNLYVYGNNDPVDYVDPTGQGFWSTFGKILAGIVVAVAVIVAVAVVVGLIMYAGGAMLGAALVGAVIGGIADGWQGAALGAMMGATIGINLYIGGAVGIINFLGVFPGIREEQWYKSLAGWSSWFMPASWPGHIMGLGVFLGNSIAHVFGSDKQIESVRFDWKHGQILTAGGEYGGSPFPFLGLSDAEAHNLGGFSFVSNDEWTQSGSSWEGVQGRVDHETGHMLSNTLFGFWQGIVNGIENVATKDPFDRLFEQIAESNVNESDRRGYGNDLPFWH